MANYILVANKVDSMAGGYIAAREIAQRRLAAGRWPLFKNTPHQKEVQSGDRLLIYLAGDKEGRFVAVSNVLGVEGGRNYSADGSDALTNAAFQQLLVGAVEWLLRAVPIVEVKNQLSFVPKGTRKWGCVLQRGMKRISNDDSKIILDYASAH